MRRNCCLLFSSFLLMLILISPLTAVEILFFYEKGCPHSAKINAFLEKRIKPNYQVEVRAYEIHEPSHARLMTELARTFQATSILKKGVPAVFVGTHAFQGSSRAVQRKIEEATREALRENVLSPFNIIAQKKRGKKPGFGLTLPAVIGAATASALNPCSGAVFALLLATILVSSRGKNKVFAAGFSFTLATFISYFLIGLGLFSFVRDIRVQHYAVLAVAVLAVLIGLWNIKDFFWKKSRLPELPLGWQHFIKRSTSRFTPLLGASLIGIAASIFLLPCTSGPYIVIIGMLGSFTIFSRAIWLLGLYNFIFILPFIAITLVIGLGFSSTAGVEMWRKHRLRKFRLITGSIMLSLGLLLVFFLVSGIL